MSTRLQSHHLERLLEILAQDNEAWALLGARAPPAGTAAHRLHEANHAYWSAEIARVGDGRLDAALIADAARLLNTIEYQQAVFGPLERAGEILFPREDALGLRLVWARADHAGTGASGLSSDQILVDPALAPAASQAAAPSATGENHFQVSAGPAALSLSHFAGAIEAAPAVSTRAEPGGEASPTASRDSGRVVGFNSVLACLYLQTEAPAARPYDGWDDFQTRNGLSLDVISDLKTAYPDGFSKLDVWVGLSAVASKRPENADAIQTALADQVALDRAMHNFDGLALLTGAETLDHVVRLELPDLIGRHSDALLGDPSIQALLAGEVQAETVTGDGEGLPANNLAPVPPAAHPASGAALDPLPAAGPAPGMAPDAATGSAVVAGPQDVVPDSITSLASATLPDGGAVERPEDLSAVTETPSVPISSAASPTISGFATDGGGELLTISQDKGVNVHVVLGSDVADPGVSRLSGKTDRDNETQSRAADYDDPCDVASPRGNLVLPEKSGERSGANDGRAQRDPDDDITYTAAVGYDTWVMLDVAAGRDVRIEAADWVDEASDDGTDCDGAAASPALADDGIGLSPGGGEYVLFALGSDTLILNPEHMREPGEESADPFWPVGPLPVQPTPYDAYGFAEDRPGPDLWQLGDDDLAVVLADCDGLRLASDDGKETDRGDLLCL